jgi:hypothetical protein
VVLTLRVLGLELLHVEVSTDDPPPQQSGPGDCTTTPIGFAPSHGDQRWERGADL